GRIPTLAEGAVAARRARPARPGPRPAADARTQAVRGRAGAGRSGRCRGAGAALGTGGIAGAAVRAGTGREGRGIAQAIGGTHGTLAFRVIAGRGTCASLL